MSSKHRHYISLRRYYCGESQERDIYRSESTTRNVAPNGDGGVGGLSPQVTPRFRIGQGVHARVAIDLYDNNVIEDVRGIVVKIEDYSGIEEYRDQFSLSYHTLQRLDAGQPIYKIRVGWMQKEYFCSEGQLTAVPMSRYTCKQCGKSYSGMVGGGGVCPKCQKDINQLMYDDWASDMRDAQDYLEGLANDMGLDDVSDLDDYF